MLKLRSPVRDIPGTMSDLGCISFVSLFIPLCFVFQLCVVLPEFHEPGSLMFILTWIGGLFVVFQIAGNFLACMLVDTSIRATILTPPQEPQLRKLWRFCSLCETLAPIRSWHCDSCKTCVLKRDHHCIFTGNCVGYRNQRYFILFLVYVIIGCSYCCLYNCVYFWYLHKDIYLNSRTLMSLICPFVGFFFDISWKNVYLLTYELGFISLLYALILFLFHWPNVLRGSTTHESLSAKYDMGREQNLEMVFGKRWRLVWLSPLLESELPHDGVHWESLLRQSSKNR
ncbi:probable palmitoyltransferase ZDHHC24 [Musca domestica]|uniref:Palmitoyltransferase n=1 Tax=Musca domestica TaxID=7370 RepID=A0A1I8NEQ3_MUSDO|nr:probable palmitoyltransferase ZDHHC24 [Musca domestica]